MKYFLTLLLLLTSLHAGTIDVRVTANTQNSEERVSDGMMDNNDAALNMAFENNNKQIVGMRFTGIALPANATVNVAYLQFRAHRSDSGNTNLIISAEASANAGAITKTDYDLSGRTETTATYAWNSVPAWTRNNDYQTGDISAIVQEVKDSAGWTSGNAMLFMVKAGANCVDSTCQRRAKSYNNSSANAPLLHIEYSEPPIMGAIADQSGVTGRFFDLNLSDYVTPTDGDPVLSYTLTGSLPSGLTFDSTSGRLSGTPSAEFSGSFSVYVTDKDGDSNSVSFNLTITLAQPPIMATVPDQTVAINGTYSYDLSAYVTPTNGDPILSYTLTGTLPAGLTFDSATGIISGTPTAVETQTLSVYATDIDGDSGTSTFTLTVIDTNGLQVEFRMDECYWLGGANGVDNDVKDSSGFHLDAQSRNRADNTASNFKICRAGDFNNTYTDKAQSDAVFYPNGSADELNIGKDQPFSISAWVYRHDGGDKWMAAVIKVSDDSWTDGWGLEHSNASGNNIDFFVGDYGTYARTTLSVDTWTHVIGTYDGSDIRIYKNGVLQDTTAQNSYSPGTLAVSIGDDISGSSIDDRWQGNIDEVKIWNRALSDTEVQDIYNNENAGLNYDGTARTCDSCNGAPIAANTWELIGIPADDRTAPLTVNDVFGDDMVGTLGTDWIIYKRSYDAVTNDSSYTSLALADTLEFGKGYWLGSKHDARWDVDGTTAVDYNSSYNGTAACTSPTGKCVDIPLVSVNKNFGAPDFDPDDGTGAFRNNMTGFIGIRQPVNWADCRLIFDDNGTVYTPSDANASGLANKQIWLYDPTDGNANSNGYVTCTDTSPGGCKLVPFKGLWIQMNGTTKGHSVTLVVPEKS